MTITSRENKNGATIHLL